MTAVHSASASMLAKRQGKEDTVRLPGQPDARPAAEDRHGRQDEEDGRAAAVHRQRPQEQEGHREPGEGGALRRGAVRRDRARQLGRRGRRVFPVRKPSLNTRTHTYLHTHRECKLCVGLSV